MEDAAETTEVVIIGSGMGGMTTARLLQEMRGDRVLVLERHTAPGGMTHEFVRRTEIGDFAFSTGLHYLGDEVGPTAPRTLISFLTGGAMQWARLPDAYDVYLSPSGRFDAPSTLSALGEALAARFPSEAAAIRQYYDADVPAAAAQLIRLNVANAFPAPLRALAFPLARAFSKLALSRTQDVLDARFSDPELKAILAFQWGDYGRSPQHTAFGVHARIISHYGRGAVYPIGGSVRIARKTIDMIERNGGEVRPAQEALSILVEKGRAAGVVVRDAPSGRVYTVRAKAVVSSAGARNTYERLLPPEHGAEGAAALAALGSTISAIVLFVGFKRSPATLGFDGANYWTFTGSDHQAAAAAPPGEGPLYFSFASLKNPAARTHVAEIVSLCDLAHFEQWADLAPPHDDPSYQAVKHAVTEAILTRAEALFPGFRDLVAYAELATPLTFRTYQNSIDGAFYGLPASPERLLSPHATARTPVKDLYLSGQDALIPGIVGAAAGGARCAALMLGLDKTSAVFRTIMRAAAAEPSGPWNGFLRITRIVDETPSIRSFFLTALDGDALPFSWKGGQFLNVFLPTEGAKTVRSYSISSAEGQLGRDALRLSVKREPGGAGSTFLHDRMAVGDLLEVSGPHGVFTLGGAEEEVLEQGLALIGGGVGVTPLMSVLEELHLAGSTRPVSAIFAFRSQDEIAFRSRLADLAAETPSLSVTFVISDAEDASWTGPTGYITPELLQEVCPDITRRRVHLCGPAAMMDAVSATLAALGAPANLLHTESFGAATPTPRPSKGAAFTVHFKRSGKSAEGRVGDTILDAAVREKVVIPHACGVGTCGTCRMRVLAGAFEAPATDMLSRREQESGFVLACQTRPQGDIEIDL